MGKKYSEQSLSSGTNTHASRSREPLVFVVSSDKRYLESVLADCADVPDTYDVYPGIDALMTALADRDKIDLAFAIIVEKTGVMVDAPLLRLCKLDYPQLHYVMLLGECEQSSHIRFQSFGVQSVLLPPFSSVSLKDEISTALPNIPQFKRHPDLMKRGRVRLDFLIPSDLSYVLGVNYLVSTLLKEFGFPPADCRVNIPLACDEALTNAIIHGNHSDPDKKVNIQLYISASRIKLRIMDQGEGFDADTVDDPTEGEALLRPSGRGVYLLKTIMDSVEYKDGGRVVELEKTNASSAGSD